MNVMKGYTLSRGPHIVQNLGETSKF